jgi:hypothetical protein
VPALNDPNSAKRDAVFDVSAQRASEINVHWYDRKKFVTWHEDGQQGETLSRKLNLSAKILVNMKTIKN